MEIKISGFFEACLLEPSWLRYPNLKKLHFALKKMLALASKNHN